MTMRRLADRVATAACLAVALIVAASPARASEAVEIGGVKFEPTASVGAARLGLNGAGVRYKAIIKVYAAGLYLPAKASSPEQVWATQGAKRMHIVMLRDIDGNELGKLFTRGMEDNANREEFAKLVPGVLRMGEIFSSRKKLSAGESFSVDFVPGTGVVILVNGKPVAEPIREPEFFEMMMRIWLGKSPADRLLKEALLGKPANAPGA